ncbi:DUF3644 domain-containing protein [Rhodanobacter soli]|uniref:DUF3644 domain-containing protein n=1 Tax=Rhodanobacter soli TaxID=590609 RepID=A0ABV2PYM4_9GAMM
MPRGLPQAVKDNLEKCQLATLAAVDAYNRPGRKFRTAQFLVMIVIAWTALFHAIYYRRNIKPWYKLRNGRFERVDGDPKHWDLSQCLKQYYVAATPPERKNLEFLIGLRNKIEHRHLPELDASLYGECQATLLNLEELLVSIFGAKYSVAEQLAVSLQFSSVVPPEKKRAARALAVNNARSVKDYIETFRGNLPAAVLNSMKYSFNVFLVPKVANRESAADASVEFIKINEASPEELKRLEKLNVLIKEKKIPIANLDLYKPSFVVQKINQECRHIVSQNAHSDAWRHFGVRPPSGGPRPEHCRTEYCVYDEAHRDYLYTQAWINKCVQAFSSADSFREITGRKPVVRGGV